MSPMFLKIIALKLKLEDEIEIKIKNTPCKTCLLIEVSILMLD